MIDREDNLTPTVYLRELFHDTFSVLSTQHEWLHTNRNIAYIQLLISDRLYSYLEHVQHHANFKNLIDNVREYRPSMNNEDIVNSLQACICLAMPHDHPLIRELLNAARLNLPTMNIHEVMSLSYSMRTLPGIDAITARLIMRRYRELTLDNTTLPLKSLTDHCQTQMNLLLYCNDTSVKRNLSWLYRQIDAGKRDLITGIEDSNHLGQLARLSQKLFGYYEDDKKSSRCILDSVSRASIDLSGQLNSANIAEICHALKKARLFENRVAESMQHRANQILVDMAAEGDVPIRDISNLYYALTRYSCSKIRATFEDHLYAALSRVDTDIVVLSNLSDSLASIGHIRHDLVTLYQSQIASKADRIVQFSSRCQKIIRFLNNKRFRSKDNEFKFKESLLDFVQKRQGIYLYSMPYIATFILPTCEHTLPESFYRKLVTSIPQWRATELYRLAIGLNAMRQPGSGLLRRQIAHIQGLLYSNIGESIETDVYKFQQLYQLSLGLVVKNRKNHDITLTEKLMSLYPRFTNSRDVSDVSIIKTCQIFTPIAYHYPKVFDDLVATLLNDRDPTQGVSLKAVNSVILLLSTTGYTPRNMNVFVKQILTPICFQHLKDNQLRQLLTLLCDLTQLKVYIDDILNPIFQMSFLENLDKYMEDKAGERSVIERSMMRLNRDVIIERPELDIPWFHASYRSMYCFPESRSTNAASSRFKDEVHNCLMEYLGGPTYVRRWMHSEYFHRINFICYLDKEDKCVEISDASEIDESLTRVAILTLTDDHFCYNSRRLTGKMQCCKRQLELLGYHVIQIPSFEWYSMSLSTWTSKIQYLNAKIGAK